MLSVGWKRLWSRPLLTLLSILGVTLAVGPVVSIPIFAKAVSFSILRQELDAISSASARPPFSMRIYVLPSGQYPLSVGQAAVWEQHLIGTITAEVGLPVVAHSSVLERSGLVLRTPNLMTAYGAPQTVLLDSTKLVVSPGIADQITIIVGEPMDSGTSMPDVLDVWLHHVAADRMGISPGEQYELHDLRRNATLAVCIAGTWQATDPHSRFWFQDPDLTLQDMLLVPASAYQAIAELWLEEQVGFASWYVILDDRLLTSQNMRQHTTGLGQAKDIVEHYLPSPHIDGSPLEALNVAIRRETGLVVQMFAYSVPLMGFLLYFMGLLSAITLRWQQRETAIMVSRGMYGSQLLLVGLIESGVIIGLALPLGLGAGLELAQVMGYTETFMRFASRVPIPLSITALNLPMLLAALGASLLARLGPVYRMARTSVIAHERRRARAPQRPFRQRYYLDFLLVIPVGYAYQRLSARGTLVPPSLTEDAAGITSPLLFLVPALFTLTLSLLLVRTFPLAMRLGDWLSSLGRRATLYLAFRQLSRQSGQYTNALLLVITSLSLGGFMASMALSLDRWLIDQVRYEVGSDVLVRQMVDPESAEQGLIPEEGAWVLPVQSYLEIPGVRDAARVGMYEATIHLPDRSRRSAVFIGVDRLDVPHIIFFRSDFARQPLGALMNQLASRPDAILLSESVMGQGHYELGDKISMHVTVLYDLIMAGEFRVAGTFRYFPTVYEQLDGETAVVGNLDYLFDRIGGTMLHNIWLRIDPEADKREMRTAVEEMGVFVNDWIELRELVAEELARFERVGMFGTLTIGFVAAAVLSGIGLLIYNWASLQERLFRFAILRAVGLLVIQVIAQVIAEYAVLMVYSVLGGALIGAWASRLFIPFSQAADQNVLRPPSMIPLIAWNDIWRISAVFTVVLVLAQIAVIAAVLRKGAFQALRMGDQE